MSLAEDTPAEMPEMTQEIVKRTERLLPAPVMSESEFADAWRVANALALSGMFTDSRQPAQAFAKMVIGRDLGLSPAQSMQGLYLVEGKVQVAYPMLGQFINARDGYSYKPVSHSAEECTIEFFRDGESLGTSTFTIQDAKNADLIKDKSAWKKYPRNMLFARAMSNGVKWYMPEVTNGMPVYVEDEITPPAPQLTDGSTDPVSSDLSQISPEWWAEIEEKVGADARGHLQAMTAEWPDAKIEMTLAGRDKEALMALLAGWWEPVTEDAGEEVTAEPLEADMKLNENADLAEDESNAPEPLDEVNRGPEFESLRHQLLDLEIEEDSLGGAESDRASIVRMEIARVQERMAEIIAEQA